MAAAFAALESRLNQAVFARIANAVATLPGWEEVDVVFDKAGIRVLDGLVESSGPQCSAPSAAVCSLSYGDTLIIDGTTYSVTGIEPDGTGITTLQLRA